MEPPIKLTISRQTSMESGTASSTATVARGLPRKMRIITPVMHQPDDRLARDVGDSQLDEDRLIEDHGGLESVRNIDELLDRGLNAVDDRRWCCCRRPA